MNQQEQIENFIEKGLNNTKIAKKFNVSLTTIGRWIKQYGLMNYENNKNINKLTEQEIEKIKKLYKDGHNCNFIAKMIGRYKSTVRNALIKNGFKIDKSRKRDKKITNCVICGEHMTNYSYGARRCGTCTTNIRRYRVKLYAVNYKGGKCECCGWSGNIAGFDFHHTDDKNFNLTGSNMASMKLEKVKEELDKCKLLCATCHRLEHNIYDDEIMLVEIKNYTGKLFVDSVSTQL